MSRTNTLGDFDVVTGPPARMRRIEPAGGPLPALPASAPLPAPPPPANESPATESPAIESPASGRHPAKG